MIDGIYKILWYYIVVNGAAVQTARAYWEEALGSKLEVEPWRGEAAIPYFLKDAYDLRLAKILGNPFLLAIERRDRRPRLNELRIQLNRLAEVTGLKVVYLVGEMDAYERRKLIEDKIAFIVPGNQMYLPPAGIDLREQFRPRKFELKAGLPPAAQAILIRALLSEEGNADWPLAEFAHQLGYSPMTTSRAAKEIAATGVAVRARAGRNEAFRFVVGAEKAWEQAAGFLRNPVRASVWLAGKAKRERDWVAAGESALAKYSMIGEPSWPVYALGPEEKHSVDAEDIVPEPEDGSVECQFWSYDPRLGEPERRIADPLSLSLTFRDVTDERMEIALDELKRTYPWSKG